MNPEKQRRMQPTRGQGEDMLSPNRPPHMKKKQPNPGLLRVLRLGMLGVGSLILVLCLVLAVLPLFRVNHVEIFGNGYYSEEQILQSAGIALGDESLAIDPQQVCDRLFEKAPYVQSCKVSVSPVSVKIEIKEKENVMYALINNHYVSFEYRAKTNSFYVLEVKDSKESFVPFLRVTLPTVVSAEVGRQMIFSGASDLTYTKTLTDALKEQGVLEQVDSIDFSKTSALSYCTKGGCTVKLGNLEDLTTKLTLAKNLIASNGSNLIEVDVRDVQEPTTKTGTE